MLWPLSFTTANVARLANELNILSEIGTVDGFALILRAIKYPHALTSSHAEAAVPLSMLAISRMVFALIAEN
jgi:hypothetical protein